MKKDFFFHFSDWFAAHSSSQLPLAFGSPKLFSYLHISDLEGEVTQDEIKQAVWDCGVDKSHGLDGFSFELFQNYWDLVAPCVVSAVHEFFSSSVFPKGCNSSLPAQDCG